MRGDEDEAAGQPVSGVGDEIADDPFLIVKVAILHMADFAIGGAEFVTVQLFEASQHESLSAAEDEWTNTLFLGWRCLGGMRSFS